jgi:hypothetical protein
MDLDDRANARKLRITANAYDDTCARDRLRAGEAPHETRARRRSGEEPERMRPTQEALAGGASLDDCRRPGGNAVTDVGTREPPPADGMQPRNGRKVGALAELPAYIPKKTADRDVVIPGLTGLPSVPRKLTSMARRLNRASRPPTTWFFGQVSWNSTRCRGAVVEAGTTTHGPGTETQTMSPSHSFAPPAGAATASAAPVTTSAQITRRRLTEPS